MFMRSQLFPNDPDDPDWESSEPYVLVMKDDLTIEYEKIKRSQEPRIIQELKSLNQLRKYYAHGRSTEFLSSSNRDNFISGSLKILSNFTNLIRRLQGDFFPEVIVPRRFIQVESDWMRMDYIGEDNPNHLSQIRFDRSALDYLRNQEKGPDALLNQEAYLFQRQSDNKWLARSLYILPVNEEIYEDKLE